MGDYNYKYNTDTECTNSPTQHYLIQTGTIRRTSDLYVIYCNCTGWHLKDLTVELEKVNFHQSTGTVVISATARNARTCIAKVG